jgi:hypothetical protein
LLPLLLERVGERRIKFTIYIPLIPAFSLKGEGADTYINNPASGEGFFILKSTALTT